MLDIDHEIATPNTAYSTNTFLHRSVEIMFTQTSAKRGIAQFRERAVATIIKEYKQLDEGSFPVKPVVEPIAHQDLTKEQKNRALEAVNPIKEKKHGIIKGRTCADGSKKRKYLKEGNNISSPTVSL